MEIKVHNLYPGELEFTSEFAYSEITFLDLRISRNVKGFLETDLFVKPTFKNLYLKYDSYHSRHTLDNIAYGHALRIRTICSTEDSVTKNLDILKSNLIERGYPPSTVTDKIGKACTAPRSVLLNREGSKKSRKKNHCPLGVTRNPRLPLLSNIVKRHFPILQLSPIFSKTFPNPPSVIYKQPPNLKSLLVKAKIREKHNFKGCFRTHDQRCVTCSVLKETSTFQSKSTGQIFQVKGDLTCTTKGVIYLLNCLDCQKQYVGETGSELRIRHRGHRQEFKKALTPIGKHFQVCKNFELIGIEKIRNNNKKKPEKRLS
ncbi:hypothetical protein HOLleu_20245 [Holothuria leucospilota]|uniref:Helix-turn-helix domain-containing protein n=1 Tax=Holothuria leucospilota TaxID=206669 RepID=A0A9Q1C0T3_HOLLE|nr:hypothetical protein HOLleu_20245 [Holothuria leucospilota]